MRKAVIVACAAVMCAGTALVGQDQKSAATPKKPAPAAKAAPTDAELVRLAMTGAPQAIGKNATIVTMTADMKMRTLRKGTNGFTCAPEPDPMCADQNAMEWFDAYLGKKDPPKGKVGFVYMLMGDQGVSNTDPYAESATATNNWVKTGPHVMIVGAIGMTAGYPHDAKADPAKPYVMWPGTPYEHLMLPTK
jgi:hypothetical protein